MGEVVLALLRRELVEVPADGVPELLLGASGRFSEERFQLCEELLDWVQVRFPACPTPCRAWAPPCCAPDLQPLRRPPGSVQAVCASRRSPPGFHARRVLE